MPLREDASYSVLPLYTEGCRGEPCGALLPVATWCGGGSLFVPGRTTPSAR